MLDRDQQTLLHQEPLRPFTALETLLSVPRLGVGLTHLGGWLVLFNLLDKTLLDGRRFDRLGKFVCRRVTDLAGVRVSQHGLDHLAPGASYIFSINHVSLLDLFVVFQSIPYFHRSFQDQAHFKIPIYGGCIRVFGQVPVKRGDRAYNRRAFEQAAEMIRQGDSFVVFPEGHRTRDGRLGRFHPGAFRLADTAGVPVVPMALRGLRDVCPAGDWRVRPGQVDVIFGQPIPPERDATALARKAHQAVNALLAAGP